MDRLRAKMLATIYHPMFIYFKVIANSKRDEFVAHPNTKPWEVFSSTFRPLKFHVLKTRVLLGCLNIFLEILKVPANRTIDTMPGKEDTATEVERLTKRTLPKTGCFRISQWRKLIVQQNLLHIQG